MLFGQYCQEIQKLIVEVSIIESGNSGDCAITPSACLEVDQVQGSGSETFADLLHAYADAFLEPRPNQLRHARFSHATNIGAATKIEE